MNALWLLRYIGCVFALLAFMASLVTYHPDIRLLGSVLPPALLGAAILTFLFASLLGRLPSAHWLHQSMLVKCGLFAVAATATLLLVAVG